ncbi:uncharacterized protein GGS25DRAFT_385332 [Hypoxylon fragiforme]|uniref:uncharacterized protein n=1 Tax=Hypoxylon fragiforme TaxID=63214 RepID=UPI0020C615BF|nr:uncharacterized protein GGS25DRAFT_385332 [Hypoxylon fragiforme]KAI2606338.1 hypothetical protein GGS25DRAFT_385332 [Hypoxylon fragiforme]
MTTISDDVLFPLTAIWNEKQREVDHCQNALAELEAALNNTPPYILKHLTCPKERTTASIKMTVLALRYMREIPEIPFQYAHLGTAMFGGPFQALKLNDQEFTQRFEELKARAKLQYDIVVNEDEVEEEEEEEEGEEEEGEEQEGEEQEGEEQEGEEQEGEEQEGEEQEEVVKEEVVKEEEDAITPTKQETSRNSPNANVPGDLTAGNVGPRGQRLAYQTEEPQEDFSLRYVTCGGGFSQILPRSRGPITDKVPKK